jgi:hypothetical protein
VNDVGRRSPVRLGEFAHSSEKIVLPHRTRQVVTLGGTLQFIQLEKLPRALTSKPAGTSACDEADQASAVGGLAK